MPVVTNQQKSLNRDTILIEHLWEFENIPPSEGVRTAEWKYFRYVNNKSWEGLYNLKTDPKETNNLANNPEYKNVLENLRNKTSQLTQKFADPILGAPSGLTVETIRNPRFTNIIDSKPEFSWVVPQGAGIQKAYQILVSSEKVKIENNIGDVWNSGIVRSSQSFNVEFDAQPLKENTSYFWKVRIFDADNWLSEYSAAQQFETGDFGGKLTSHNWFQVERIKPVHFKKNDDDSYFVDFGKDAFGTLEMIYSANKAETLTIRLGEKLLDGKIDRNPGGTIRYSEVKLQVEPGKTNYQLKLVPDRW